MKVSVILGFQCLLARNVPSRHHANICWQSMVLDRQKVQAKESEAARNGPSCTLQIAHQAALIFGSIHLSLHMELVRQTFPEGWVVNVQADRENLLRDFVGDAEDFVVVGTRLKAHLVVQHGACVITNVHGGVNGQQEKANPEHIAATQ